MAKLHLVTGYAGENHITASDVASLNAAIFGTGQCVLNRGSQLAATIVTNNKISVADGDIMMQGRHIRLAEGTTVDLTIENGAQGYMRNDLIVARYTKDSNGVEECALVVIKGTAVTSNPVDPEYTHGDLINEQAVQNDMPLYRVPLNGLNIGGLVPLFTIVDGIGAVEGIKKRLEALEKDGGIATKQIASGAVTTAKLADGAVTPEKIASGAVTPEKLSDQPVPMTKGGTMARDGATGLKNLLASGAMVLSAHQYGNELPEPGIPGRIFFKKV